MRPQGSPAELERRRLRAIDLLQRDLPVHVVAERLGVDRRSVRRWKRAYRGDGRAGLRARPASGRPPKLTAAQRRQLVRAVVAGPVEATSLGNIAVQMVASGAVGSLAEARDVIERSFPIERFDPIDHDRWDAQFGRFKDYCAGDDSTEHRSS